MIIKNSARGPKYSTDSMADHLTAFMNSRRAATPYVPSITAAGCLTNLEALYPSLFEVRQVHGVRTALVEAGLKVAVVLGSLRRFRPIARLFSVIALTALLAPLQVNAAVSVYGEGYGYGSSRTLAYSYAYAYAHAEAESVCLGSFVDDLIVQTYTYWSVNQWASYVRVAGMCI